jgi:DNA-binding NarL/FixJ family response regulator
MSTNINRVIVVDDQVLVRAGIQALLGGFPEFTCTAAVSDGHAALEACQAHPPDLILVDMIMPGMDGLTLASALRERHPAVKVLILSSSTEAALVRQVMSLGVCGYVSKDFVLDELVLALRTVTAGRIYISPEVSVALMHQPAEPDVGLTPKQCEVLRGIAQGHPNKQIARDMGISLKTVAYHRAEIMARLKLHDVASLTRYALERGVIGPAGGSGASAANQPSACTAA